MEFVQDEPMSSYERHLANLKNQVNRYLKLLKFARIINEKKFTLGLIESNSRSKRIPHEFDNRNSDTLIDYIEKNRQYLEDIDNPASHS